MPKHYPPLPPEIAHFGPGLHVNDAPQDDPTRFLVHYDGKPWPWLVVLCLCSALAGFAGGLWSGTDHYTISTACQTETRR